MRILIFLSALLIPLHSLYSGGVIRGHIIDGFNQLPLSQANISVLNTEMGTTSDEDGAFTLTFSEGGYYSISIAYIGYDSKILNDVWVRPNGDDYQNVVLYPMAIEFENIVVTENYFTNRTLSNYSSTRFKNDEIRRAPGAGGEITRILNSLPSVASVGENRQDIMVRGGGPTENGFLIDNIYIPNISHFSQPDGRTNGPVGMINTELIEKLEFFSSGFSPEYGNKLSSYGDVTYREGNNQSIQGTISLGLGGAGGLVEGPINKNTTFLSSFRMSYLDVISDAINAGGLPSYNDYQGKINYKPNQHHNFTFLGIYGNSLYDRNKEDAINANEDSYGTVENNQETIGVNHRFIWNKNAYSKNSLSLSNQNSKINFFGVLNDSLLNGIQDEYNTIHLRNVNHVRFQNKYNTVSGVEIHQRILHYDFRLNDISFDDKVVFKYLSIFFNISSNFRKSLTGSIGTRIETSNFDNKINVSPRANMDFAFPGEMGKMIVHFGRYFQNPPEKYIGLAGDNNLKSVYADQISLTYEKLFTESTKFSVSLYNKRYNNAPQLNNAFDLTASPVFLMDKNLTFTNIISNGEANAKGIEWLLEKKRAQNFYGLMGGSLFNSTFIDYKGIERNRDNNYQYIFNVVGGYRPNSRYEISIRWSMFGGRPYTKIDTERSLLYNESVYFNDQYNEERTPIYHNLFLRYEYRKVFRRCNMISYIELWNAYNRKNIETYSWSSSAEKIIETTYFSFIPVGGFEIEF